MRRKAPGNCRGRQPSIVGSSWRGLSPVPGGLVSLHSDRRQLRSDPVEKQLVKYSFIVMIPLLFLQIPLRHIYDFEPYPAILLPSGASTVRDTGFISFTQKNISAITTSGQRLDVNVHDLLSTLPLQYRSYVVDGGLGFSLTGKRRKQLPSEIVAKEGRAWLKNRLRSILDHGDFVKLEIVEYRVVKSTRYSTSGLEVKTLGSFEIHLE